MATTSTDKPEVRAGSRKVAAVTNLTERLSTGNLGRRRPTTGD